MLFNAKRAEILYNKAKRGDKAALEAFHLEAKALIEAIAASTGPYSFEDLVQEGHLKLQKIVAEQTYQHSQGNLYAFLSTALKNAMIDWLRKERECQELTDEIVGKHDELEEEHPMDLYSDYMTKRFPVVDKLAIQRIVTYVVAATKEGVVDGCKGAIRTMCTEYGIGRRWSATMYSVVMALMRMDAMGVDWQPNIDEALSIASNGTALTLIPEMVLLNGLERVQDEVKVFGGSYVKF